MNAFQRHLVRFLRITSPYVVLLKTPKIISLFSYSPRQRLFLYLFSAARLNAAHRFWPCASLRMPNTRSLRLSHEKKRLDISTTTKDTIC